MQYAYIFLVREHERRAHVDSWLEVTDHVGDGALVAMVRARMTKTKVKGMKDVSDAYEHMRLRSRFNNDIEGPCLVKTDFTLTPEELEQHFEKLPYPTYKAFIRNSRI